jgi:hypothetical protein
MDMKLTWITLLFLFQGNRKLTLARQSEIIPSWKANLWSLWRRLSSRISVYDSSFFFEVWWIVILQLKGKAQYTQLERRNFDTELEANTKTSANMSWKIWKNLSISTGHAAALAPWKVNKASVTCVFARWSMQTNVQYIVLFGLKCMPRNMHLWQDWNDARRTPLSQKVVYSRWFISCPWGKLHVIDCVGVIACYSSSRWKFVTSKKLLP